MEMGQRWMLNPRGFLTPMSLSDHCCTHSKQTVLLQKKNNNQREITVKLYSGHVDYFI